MLEYIKKLITPDMVSFWLPSGQNRAMDIIRGNHGQCFGTHPNVLVLPSLINSSVGWHFDGDDDVISGINFGSPTTYGTTQGYWINKDALVGVHRINNAPPFVCGFSGAPFFVHTTTSSGTDNNTPNAAIGLSAETWHFLVVTKETLNDNEVNVYLDGVLKETGDLVNAANGYITLATFYVGNAIQSFDGFIAFPLVANKAWSQQQVNNFYLATKGLFAPRG